MQIILASSSPRRRELLAQAGIQFTVMTADIDEQASKDELPLAYIKRMVNAKAQAAIQQLNEAKQRQARQQQVKKQVKQNAALPTQHEPILILTADTIGVLADGKTILTKPVDKDDAIGMWQKMSGDSHHVYTAVQASLASRDQMTGEYQILWQQCILEKTEVRFIDLEPQQMQDYWATGEPVDKAGGYAIQGKAAAWVSCIYGSYTNVVGLPLAQTVALINQAKLIQQS